GGRPPPAVNDGAGTAADVTPSTLPEPSSPRRRVPGDLRRGVMAVVTPAPEPVVGRDAFLDDLHRQPGGFEDDPDALLFGQEGGVLRLGADEGTARVADGPVRPRDDGQLAAGADGDAAVVQPAHPRHPTADAR